MDTDDLENQSYWDIVRLSKKLDVYNDGRKTKKLLINRIKEKLSKNDPTKTEKKVAKTTTTKGTNNKSKKTDTNKEVLKNTTILQELFSKNKTLIYNIIKHLDIDDIYHCELVNKEWNNVSNSNRLWELLFLKNILNIKDFSDEEKEIYSQGFIKESFDPTSTLKVREIYALCFPHHYKRFSNFNKLKSAGIIPSSKCVATNGVVNFKEKRCKKRLEELEKHVIDLYSILSSYKSKSKEIDPICSDSEEGLKPRVIHLTNFRTTRSNKRDSLYFGDNIFQILICIPNKVISKLDPNKTIIEYSRFMKAHFTYAYGYDISECCPGEDPENFGFLQGTFKDQCYDFKLFDFDKPYYDKINKKYDMDQFKENKSTENKLDLFGLWTHQFKKDFNRPRSIDEGYVKDLENFTRGTISFGIDEYSLHDHSLYELKGFLPVLEYSIKTNNPINSDFGNIFDTPSKFTEFYNQCANDNKIDGKLILKNLIWKLDLYNNIGSVVSKSEENNLSDFFKNSIILNYCYNYGCYFYEQKKQVDYEFGFSIPYDKTNNLMLNFSFQNIGENNNIDFSITYQFLDKENKPIQDQEKKKLYSLSERKVTYETDLVKESDSTSLSFKNFISLLFKTKFPLFKFELSTLLQLARIDNFISWADRNTSNLPIYSKIKWKRSLSLKNCLNRYNLRF
ncbi:hypothetical protein DICPUDRAFT_98489 [Dictyostelium purpureum]|uniref:F-box domain-containing protein n=1 Tax=Dictyostelium purpureum TaxID=5786 RepID=F0ZQT4_DICPU|nr:uncharacterized protein DICPUDRAFT_98489 [Dictyostelium purpureum]EGC33696.1 hypothetical protein DICPUDRAFT_98489 [Dictyostelium purpureum]|eukprot:XP_003289773.1 hypothetical protein DICPUDRAFT_98489 [Dictyostelium purpureum]